AGTSGLRDGRLTASPGYAAAVAAWLLGLVLLGVAWWWLGRLPGPDGDPSRPGWRWLVGTGLLWALPPLAAPPLGSRDVYAYACQGWLWLHGGDPYGAGPSAAACPWADEVPPLWRDAPSPYGPLAIGVSGLAVAAARALPGDDLLAAVALLRLAALGGVALVLWPGARLARRCGVRPADAARLGVVTPLVLLHAVSGAHHDALLAGLLVAACAAAYPRAVPPRRARGFAAPQARPGGRWWTRAIGGGALLGLAAAVKVTALVAAPFLMLLVAGAAPRAASGPAPPDAPARARPAPAGWLGRGAAALAAAAGAFAALSLATGLGLGWVGALTGTSALRQWTSLPTGVGMGIGYALRAAGYPQAVDAAVAGARLAGLVALAVALAALWWRAAGRPAAPATAVAAAGWGVLAAALLAPVVYPWYLLAPLGVLAAAVPSARPRRWLAAGTLGAAALVFPDGLGVAVLTKGPGAVLVTAAAVVGGWLALRRLAARRPAGRVTGSGPPGPAR
ncbi:MAG TPA: polyprenol phosphomannose-dependent alpha 1,6 mannosyltransferase MptB, partial [Pilimelia sp.]|nr:polyprenol phosphomannose-dependent alpha 1,6 mannosyltransferase MptB [Pilimelia sp.]